MADGPAACLRMPLDTRAGALAVRDADYGRVVVRVGGVMRETRSSSEEELADRVFDAAGRTSPVWVDPPYPGYPIVVDGGARTALAVLAYLLVPLAFVVLGVLIPRSRRRS